MGHVAGAARRPGNGLRRSAAAAGGQPRPVADRGDRRHRRRAPRRRDRLVHPSRPIWTSPASAAPSGRISTACGRCARTWWSPTPRRTGTRTSPRCGPTGSGVGDRPGHGRAGAGLPRPALRRPRPPRPGLAARRPGPPGPTPPRLPAVARRRPDLAPAVDGARPGHLRRRRPGAARRRQRLRRCRRPLSEAGQGRPGGGRRRPRGVPGRAVRLHRRTTARRPGRRRGRSSSAAGTSPGTARR